MTDDFNFLEAMGAVGIPVYTICEDCGAPTPASEGRYYKYEPDTWLCDGCHDERMEEEA